MTDDTERLEAAAGWWRLYHGRLDEEGRVELPMLSGSMAPLLPLGSTLVIAGPGATRGRWGDVVVFREGDRLLSHRLLLALPPGRPAVFLQAGDGPSRAGWIRAEAVAGRVIAVRLPDGTVRALDTPAARRDGCRRARRRLARCLAAPLLDLSRRVRAWLAHS